MKSIRFMLLIALVMAAVGLYSQPSAEAAGMCTLIDVSTPAMADGNTEGFGTEWQGYLAEGTVVNYSASYDGPGGGGFDIWSNGTHIYHDDGSSPVIGSYTIPASGNYRIQIGAGTDQQVVGATVTLFVEATCQGEGTDLTCNPVASQSGVHCVSDSPESMCYEGTGFCTEAYVEAGTMLTLLAESADPACPVEGNIHFGEGAPLGQARGVGSGSTTIVAPESGTYSFCSGWFYVEDPCAYTTVTLSAFSGCRIVAAGGGCPVLLDMPKNAVVGAFVAETRAYWKPDALVEPEITFEVGKTAWVLGVDETGAYYKIVWNCDYLWVPVESMGPNYDDVWNGKPLPTDIVS